MFRRSVVALLAILVLASLLPPAIAGARTPRRSAAGPVRAAPRNTSGPAAADPGGWIYYATCDTSGDPQTYRVRPDGTGTAGVTAGTSPRVSPDGSRIAVRRGTHSRDLVTTTVTGGAVHTFPGVLALSAAAWSPDGKKLAVGTVSDTTPQQRPQIWTLPDVTGSTPVKSEAPGGIVAIDWSADQWEILYNRVIDRVNDVDRIAGVVAAGAAKGSAFTDLMVPSGDPLMPVAQWDVRFTRDGRRSWQAVDLSKPGLYIEGTWWINVPAIRQYAFSPDGTQLAVVRYNSAGTGMFVDVISMAGPFIRTLVGGVGQTYCGVDWAPDPDHHEVSGKVTSVACGPDTCDQTPLADVTVTATGTKKVTTTTAADGTWSLQLAKGSYTIKPTLTDRAFEPEHRDVTVNADPVDGVDFFSCGLDASASAAVRHRTRRSVAPAVKPSVCQLKVDWKVPERFHVAEAKYAPIDGVLTTAWANPTSWKVRLYVRVGGAMRTTCKGFRFSWHLTPVGGGSTVDRMGLANRCYVDTSVPAEGAYRVTVEEQKLQPNRTFKTTGKNGKQTVTIQDWLILAMGDSFASGEGNPDVPGNASPLWQFARCHRSFDSWQARLASMVELTDRHTSVTLLHAGCSGASIEHLIDRSYVGMEQKDEVPLRPQLQQLRTRLTGKDREVDAILLSIGVNDLDFGSVIEGCAESIRDCFDLHVRELRDADGKQKLEFDDTAPTTLAAFELDRIADMPFRYRTLQTQLAGVQGPRVFIPSYPELTKDEKGNTCTVRKNPVSWKGITVAEARWISQTGTGLNGSMDVAGGGWTHVKTTQAAFDHHGWCAKDSWIQTVNGSYLAQGNQDGAMHPIGKGPEKIADLVGNAVCAAFYSTPGCTFDPLKNPDAVRRPAAGNRLVP